METIERFRAWLKKNTKRQQTLADKAGVNQAIISMFLDGKVGLQARTFCKLLEATGVVLTYPEDRGAKEVKFVSLARNHETEKLPGPEPDRYRAIPLLKGEVAAGPGMFQSEEGLESWLLIYAGDHSVRQRNRLVAVRVGKGQRSMLPGIAPGDMVLIDLDDHRVSSESGIYMVRDPDEGQTLKRVSLFTRKGEDFLTFYSDNASEFPPTTYSLQKDFHGDLGQAIVGRAVWQWKDLT